MAALGMIIGNAAVIALAFTGGNYVFSLLDRSDEAEKERKRHDLAIEGPQRAESEYQHKRHLRLDYLNQQQLRAEQHSAHVFKDANAAAREYWLLTGGDQDKVDKVPTLNAYYEPSASQKSMSCCSWSAVALTGWAAFKFL